MLSSIMTDDDFELVKNDLINLMVAKTRLKRDKDEPANNLAGTSAFMIAPPTVQTNSKQCCKLKQMFRGLNTEPQTLKKSNTTEVDDDKALRDDCRAELNRYMRDAADGTCPLYNEDQSFNDPLKW
jgi:hypothetical protein